MEWTQAVDRSGTLLFDGDCGICVASAAWLAARVPTGRLGLLALQHVDTDPVVAALVRGRPLAASIHFARADGVVFTGARALLAAGLLVPRWSLLAMLFDHPLGHALLEPVYREIASHRRRMGRLLGLPAACPLPATRDREGSNRRGDRGRVALAGRSIRAR